MLSFILLWLLFLFGFILIFGILFLNFNFCRFHWILGKIDLFWHNFFENFVIFRLILFFGLDRRSFRNRWTLEILNFIEIWRDSFLLSLLKLINRVLPNLSRPSFDRLSIVIFYYYCIVLDYGFGRILFILRWLVWVVWIFAGIIIFGFWNRHLWLIIIDMHVICVEVYVAAPWLFRHFSKSKIYIICVIAEIKRTLVTVNLMFHMVNRRLRIIVKVFLAY